MNKQEFLNELRLKMKGLPKEEVEERLAFYSEMIDDKVEEGISEEVAVAEIGDVDEVVTKLIADTPLSKLVKERVKPKRKLSGWEITLIIITAPLWGSLLFGILTIVAVVYGSIWMIAGSLWIVDGSLAMFSLAGIINSLISIFQGNGLNFLAYIGLALASVGLAIFLFFGALRVTKMIVELTKRLTLRIKKLFVKKEKLQ